MGVGILLALILFFAWVMWKTAAEKRKSKKVQMQIADVDESTHMLPGIGPLEGLLKKTLNQSLN